MVLREHARSRFPSGIPASQEYLNVLFRNDFRTFVIRCFAELNPSTPFLPAPYIDLICDLLMACERGERRRLIINLPPRHLKSLTISVAFVAWALGRKPSRRIICASYGQELADTLARACRKIMASPFYQRAFGSILGGRNAIHDFNTIAEGYRFSTSLGGTLTGYGADIIILDDIQKADEAFSDAARKRAIEWFNNSLISRLNNQDTGIIICVSQRLHQNDLAGHLIETGEWDVFTLPAVATATESIAYTSYLRPRVFTRVEGEALHPGLAPVHILNAIRNQIGNFDFSAQYQQNPTSHEGVFINPAWLQRFNLATFDHRQYCIYQSWDIANKVGELNDYSVCTTWGRVGSDFYLIDVFRRKLAYPGLKASFIAQYERYKPSYALVEDEASGTALIQELNYEGLSVEAVSPGGLNKIMRFRAQSTLFEAGRVFVPTEAPWLNDYFHEITTFPGCKHDDQVDSTSQALAFMRSDADTLGMLARLAD